LFGGLLWAKDFFVPGSSHSNGLFFNLLDFPGNNSIWGFLLTVGIAYLLFRLQETYTFIQQRTFLPFLFFIVLIGGSYSLHNLTNGLFGAIFLLLSLWQIFSTFHKNEPIEAAFNAGLFLSIGYFFVFDFLFLIPFIFICLYIVNNLSPRLFLAMLFGLLTPAILIFGFSFWMGNLDIQLNYFVNNIQFNLDYGSTNHLVLIFSFIFTIISLIAISGCFQNRYSSSITERKNLQVLIWIFSALLIIVWARISQRTEIFPSFFAICALLFSIFFSTRFSKKNTILFIILLILQIITLILGYNGKLG
jgi:hypothetical protein